MTYNYEQSIWGAGTARLYLTSPTFFRLDQALTTLSAVHSGVSVLELGSGAGQFIRGIHALRPDLVCSGTDISTEAIHQARAAHDGVNYVLCGNVLPYHDATFDAVLIFDVLEHVDDPAATLAEVSRVLKPGGVFYCFVPCEGDRLSLWRLLTLAGIGRGLTKKHAGHIQYFSRSKLKDLVGTFFNIERTYYSEHFFGQLLGVAAFFLMERAAKRQGAGQLNNETYFKANNSVPTRLVKGLVNSLVNLESVVLQKIPSPNVHLRCRK